VPAGGTGQGNWRPLWNNLKRGDESAKNSVRQAGTSWWPVKTTEARNKGHKYCPERIRGNSSRHNTQAAEGRHGGGSAAGPGSK
jgi:hypothetical protein